MMSRISSSGASTRAPSVHSLSLSTASDPSSTEVDVLLLGSGWTGAFLLPQLQSHGISFAYTNRSGIKDNSLPITKSPIKWTCPNGGESRLSWRKAVKVLPSAKLVVVVMALKDEGAAKELVIDYEAVLHERGIDSKTKWCILSSTGAWGAGIHTSTSPLNAPSPRSASESRLLSTLKTQVTVLHLAGLYGGSSRHPLNWLPKVADTQDKLREKTSLHLIHGKDVAQAVLGVYNDLHSSEGVWGKRWIVTDGKTYDWWKLASELPSLARTDYAIWVKDFQKEYGIKALPRAFASTADQLPPRFLDRALHADDFWNVIGKSPLSSSAEATDLPISPLTGLPVNTAALSSSESEKGSFGPSPAVRPFSPTISKRQIDDLISCLKHEISREDKFPLPTLLEGTNFSRFGLTHEKFLQLRRSWLEYLTTSTHGSAQTPTWTSDWKQISSLQHFTYPLPDLLAGSEVYNTQAGLHYVRVAPSAPTRAQRKVVPLLFLSGWPSTCFEHLNVAQSLANPGVDVPLSTPAFDCVLPSHPGYLWSGSPIVDFDETTGKTTNRFTGPDDDLLVGDVGDLLDQLMVDLGFGKTSDGTGGYSLQATDWGTFVGRSMAIRHKNNVLSCHFNFLPSPPPRLQPSLVPKMLLDYAASKSSLVDSIASLPRKVSAGHFASSGNPTHLPDHITNLLGLPQKLSERDAQKVARGLDFQTTGSAYAAFHATRPGTLGEVMHSSPSALLAWIGEKYLAWTDTDPSPQEIAFVLTLWFTTSTMSRSIYPYRNRPAGGHLEVAGRRENYISQPTGYSDFPYELIPTPLEWLKGTANVVWYKEYDKGGHFACEERPVEMVADLRDFFSKF